MSVDEYDEGVEIRRLAPTPPTVIWGAVMVAALAGAGATVWRAPAGPTVDQALQAAAEDRALKREVARLAAERDLLAGRLTSLERGFEEARLAPRSGALESTGSASGPQTQAPAEKPDGFGLSLGTDALLDAVKRRWTALSARYPQQLARLAPRIQKSSAPGVYELVASPFQNRADADRACAALAEQGLACDTIDYTGDPIGRP